MAYNALHQYSMARWGISMALHESSIGRAYRNYSRQQIAYRTYGSGRAAYPGTSNHGWGIAVDLMSRQQRWVIDQVGHLFGWSKRWSDASHEWWHIKYRAARYEMVRKWHFPVLRHGMSGYSVKRLQRLLRSKGYQSVPGRNQRGHGYFGDSTRRAVKLFQKKKGLKADGIVGPATWKKLLR